MTRFTPLSLAALALLAGAAPAQQPQPKVATLLGESRVEIGRTVFSVAFSGDGKMLAVGEDSVHLFDVSGGTPQPAGLLPARVAFGIHAMVFTPDGKKLCLGGGDHSVQVWDVEKKERLFRTDEHKGDVRAMAITPDGSVLATGGDDRTVMLWDVREDGTLTERGVIKPADNAGSVRSLVFTQKGKSLVTGSSNGAFRVFNVAGRQPKQTGGFRARRGFGEVSVAASPSGNVWAISDHKTVYLLDANGMETGILNGHTANVREVAFAPDGKLLASAGEDGKLAVWSVAAQRIRVHKDRPGRFSCVAFSPKVADNGDLMVAGGIFEGTVFIMRIGYRSK